MNPNRLRDTISSAFFFSFLCLLSAAYDPLDPNGNITIKWDVISWTTDGYVAVVTMNNFQMYRHIMNPGWTLGWTWPKNQIIWSMVGARATDQGDCSKFRTTIPHCCQKIPTVVDLLPGVPYNQQIANCCKGGILASWEQDPVASVSSFQLSVGQSSHTNTTVRLPKNFTLLGPGPGYTCGPAVNVPRTVFLSPDGRRKTQAMKYRRVKITITNFNYQYNYTQWTLVAQHPNLNDVTQVFSFDYKPLFPYPSSNDTGMFYGIKYYNQLLMQAGPDGNVQSELILPKDMNTFTFKEGWAFPRKVYFNGDECTMPPPDLYPFLPNSANNASPVPFLKLVATAILVLLEIF